MKYQITCDNCGTQFIVEAGEGQVSSLSWYDGGYFAHRYGG